MQVNYALKPGHTAEKITFTLPSGVSIQSVYNEQGELTVTDNSVTVNNASGTLYVSLMCGDTGVRSIGASVTTTGGTTLPLGSGTVTAQKIFLDAAESYTSKRTGNRAEVFTTPNTPVTLTVSGVETPVAGATNAAGRLTLTYNLPEKATHGQSYALTAEANGGSARTSVTYFPAKAKLQWFGFRHYGYDITVIDNLYPDREDTYYTYYAFGDEKSKYFSLRARFESDENLDVTVTVTMQDGSVHSVPLGLIDERENGIQEYGGELSLVGNTKNHVFYEGSIPVGFEIDWNEPSTPEPDGNLIYGQAKEKAKARQQERETFREQEIEAYPVKIGDDLVRILTSKNSIPDDFTGDRTKEAQAIQKSISAAEQLFKNTFGSSFTFTLFNYGYRVSNTELFQVMTDAEYNRLVGMIAEETKPEGIQALDELRNLEAECFADTQALEAEIDAIAQQITDGLGLKEPIQEYDSWEEVLEEQGVTFEEGSYDTVQLEADGYTRMESEAGEYCWVKDNGTEQAYVWPNGIDIGTGGTGGTGSTGGGEQPSGIKMTLDSAKQAVESNWADWTRAGISDALGAVGARATSKADKLIDRITTARNNIYRKYPGHQNYQVRLEYRERLNNLESRAWTRKNIGIACTTASRGLGMYNVVSDGNQICDLEVMVAELEGKRAELDLFMDYARLHQNFECWDALFDERNAYDELLSMLARKKNHLLFNVTVGTTFLVADVASVGGADYANIAYDVGSGVTMGVRDFNIAQQMKKIERLEAKRLSICGDDWRKMPRRTLTPILDPSGIVYEAVESNVLSGVTATIYNVTSGETQWVAGDYGQRNPQTTGVSGGYAWDVPTGKWQVRFSKDGYQPAQTAALDVPPPRTNLKTAMVSTAAPTVVSAAAYPDYVELVFSQYMSTTETLTVPAGYTYEWVNKEKVNAESPTAYSKVLRLKKSAAVGDTVSVTLSGAKNYAGTALPAYSSGSLKVAVEPATLKLNYEPQIAVLVGEAKDPSVTVQVLDRNGQPIPNLTVSAAIEDTAYATVTTVKGTTDASGVAVFSVKGKLPGWTEATFAVAGSSLTRAMPVRVTIASNQAAKPVASIGGKVYTESTNSITVSPGSALTLTCATEGAVIYYTTNDTCPCQALDRQLYTGPITVNADTYFRIAAYKDGMEYSERLNLRVRVSDSSSDDDAPDDSATVERSENGSVSLSPKSASRGDIVTVTVTPDKGYTLETLTVTDSRGNELKLTEKNGKYTFIMPASKVTVKATFMEDNSMLNFFVDVPADAYYYDAVLWAAENAITSGTTDTTFSPNAPCTRAQIVTFLWRAAGSPEPKGTQSFGDVTAGSYYEKAVAWAAENGITGGTGDGKFSPGATCTRAQAVTFLYRASSASAVSSGAAFTDVAPDAYYADAVAWAAENEITGGIGGGLFAPGSNCTRAQIVTFLYRSISG